MRVTQTISIGTLRINSMSNSSIVQIGTSGAIKARAEDIKEQVTPAQADQGIENKITKEVKPILEKEGLPVQPYPPQGQAGGTQQAGAGQQAPSGAGQQAGTGQQAPSGAGQQAGTSQQAPSGTGAAGATSAPSGNGTTNGSRRQKST